MLHKDEQAEGEYFTHLFMTEHKVMFEFLKKGYPLWLAEKMERWHYRENPKNTEGYINRGAEWRYKDYISKFDTSSKTEFNEEDYAAPDYQSEYILKDELKYRGLNQRQSEIVLLIDGGYTQLEVAELMNVSASTIKREIALLKKSLQAH